MTPERWARIDELYHEAQGRSLSDRAAFLDDSCRGDHELRRQVESLLKFDPHLDGFIEVPALEVAARQLSVVAHRSLDGSLTGHTIGHYRVLEQLGTGGMGVVYKAHDQDLDRFVALKILQPAFALDSKRFSMLKQEARSASALNHTNIVTIYEMGLNGAIPFIAMEWVNGKTLRQILSSGALPFESVLQIADQLANALSKMHGLGLVHRDLKPENVMITDELLVKILDFGLAKLSPEDSDAAPDRFFVDESYRSNLVGSVGYMAPERILGHADAKSDQFSFGCILYEMASGQPAFRRDTVNETLSAIRNDKALKLDKLRTDVPAMFCRIVDRCLAKNPNDRYASTEELLLQLRNIHAIRQKAQGVTGMMSQQTLPAVLALILLLTAAIAVVPLATGLTRANKVRARQLYDDGIFHFKNRFHGGSDELEKSVEFFDQSIKSDPNFAAAYTGLANSYLVMGFLGILSPTDAYKEVLDNAKKSLDLDPNNAETHAALGRILTIYGWNWAGAEKEFKRAIELNPSYPQAYQWYGNLLVVTGRAEDGLAMSQKALDIDDLSLSFTSGKAWLLYLARRYDESVQKYQRALEIDRESPEAIEGLAEAYQMSGKVPEAFDTYQQWAKTEGMSESQITSLEEMFQKGGMKGYWRRRLEMEIEEEKGGDESTYLMATLNARVGNKEEALRWLERAFNEHHDRLILLNVDPVFDSMRSDPRFLDLVKRVGLPL